MRLCLGRLFAALLLLSAMSLPVMAAEGAVSQSEAAPAVTAQQDSAHSAEGEGYVFEPGDSLVVVAVLGGSIVLVTAVALLLSKHSEV